MIETIVVIAIIGVLGTMSVGYLLSAKPHADLERAELELVSRLNSARHLAVSEEVQTRMRFNTTPNPDQYWVERFNTTTSTWVDAGMPLYATPVGVTLSGNTFSGSTVNFNTRGSLVSGGALTLTSSAGQTATFNGNLATGRFQYVAGNV